MFEQVLFRKYYIYFIFYIAPREMYREEINAQCKKCIDKKRCDDLRTSCTVYTCVLSPLFHVTSDIESRGKKKRENESIHGAGKKFLHVLFI